SVALVAPDNPVRGYVVPGRTLALHAASASKAILAFNDPSFVRGILPFPLPELTPHTITSVDALMRELELVRKTGLAVCDAEDYEGFAGLACPVPLPGVGVIFSVGLTGTVGMLTSSDRPTYEAKLKLFAPRLAAAIQARALQART
ncbi:MAG TPA: IclR family transcriptional regulator C-terminal domain-containing protein, partial [Casimicrobiaceae bacterium]|nr:IclR family transcriptional regulator C-terminal domain-containing protein [Casimicrobiaceae bacterium]